MIEKKDYHIHTTYSDGKNTLEENVLSAIEKGMTEIGFSDHSYTFFNDSYCLKKDHEESYKKEVARLKEKYKDSISVLCGIEQDYYSKSKPKNYDYVIGSVHFIKVKGKYIPVDFNAEILENTAKEYFNGDIYAVVEKYFATVKNVVKKTNATIIGHFDLISKFNEQTPLFDENNERYVKAWKKAADKLLKTKKPFEINFGAMARGMRTTPYPSQEIREYIAKKGGKFILSSDSHKKENLCYKFEEFE